MEPAVTAAAAAVTMADVFDAAGAEVAAGGWGNEVWRGRLR